MRVRGRIRSGPIHTPNRISTSSRTYADVTAGPPTGNTATGDVRRRCSKPTVTVIGNSNVRGLATKLSSHGVDATGFVYSGTPTAEIRRRLKHCVPAGRKQPPSHVVLHTGDIDIRQNPTNAEREVLDAISETLRLFPQSKVLVSTPSAQSRDQMLKYRIKTLNRKIKDKCDSVPELSFIDCTNLPLRDNIHFSKSSKKEQAAMIARCLNYT